MLENHLLHALARVALRVTTPLRAKRMVDTVGQLFRSLSSEEAARVASRLEGHGSCLSRSLTLASRLPDSEVVIGGSLAPGQRFSAHAWVERDGAAISATHGQLREIARIK
jgi:hypothetical protein